MNTQPTFTCPTLTIETAEQGVKYFQSYNNITYENNVFIVNSEYISHLALVFLLLTLSR